MKNVNWSTVAALALIALAIFTVWGALGGWSGGMMGPGWGMMGSGWGIWSPDPSMSEFAGGMFFLLLAFIGLLAALVLWVAQNWRKRKLPTMSCPNCGRPAHASRYTCQYCGIRLM